MSIKAAPPRGELEWVENGRPIRRYFNNIAVQWPDGRLAVSKFAGRLLLITGMTERTLWVFPVRELVRSTVSGVHRRWLVIAYLFGAWTVLIVQWLLRHH